MMYTTYMWNTRASSSRNIKAGMVFFFILIGAIWLMIKLS